ncbi:SRPBCC family protein [Arsenicicoccus sp. oral taxon 190]|uniref:SRPBCC family protein n=1 Tax=Arsenicicoccus sp. oral taxon 190 TaxID=1658671 RepID=UPI00067A18AD|nr:SRPBCC family protein [Arsenicicoccus sp. oral taxon 190]AKT50763.1 polyketide cyclase [Arsenicicoccus sp. oral taxon 190]
MHTERHQTPATVDQVWAVIADGWSYPCWVVGASRMRAVSGDWPAPGARLHHSVGAWPALLDDDTEVVECEPGRRILLRAKARPFFGVAAVEITLEPQGGGTLISMREDASQGPGRFVPQAARQAAIARRNSETLTRLALIAEHATEPRRS